MAYAHELWFHGAITSANCETIFDRHEKINGMFLVRIDGKSNFVLSVFFNGAICHIILECSSQGYFFEGYSVGLTDLLGLLYICHVTENVQIMLKRNSEAFHYLI